MSAESVNTLWSSLAHGTKSQIDHSWDDVFHWFQQTDCFPKLIWKGRECSTLYLCVGIGQSEPSLPSFTVRAFDTTKPQWHGFPATMKWTPFGTVEWHPNDPTLCTISKSTKNQKWQACDGHLQTHRSHCPSKLHWTNNIEKTKQLFHETFLKKIVLARESYFEASEPWKTFLKLKKSQPNNYHFLFSPHPETVFLGASPEKLFSQNGTVLKTEALAGTRSVSEDFSENESLKEELNGSTKDQTEHQIVVDYIHTQLSKLCIEQNRLEQEVLELPHVQHLRTPIECTLHPNIQTVEILDCLHPTPAVCGIPKGIANEMIAELEPFHRGWYAGTMGIEHNHKTDFTVMIRSALWVGEAGYAWSGAGIVEGSDAHLEWNEIENKAKQFIHQENV